MQITLCENGIRSLFRPNPCSDACDSDLSPERRAEPIQRYSEPILGAALDDVEEALERAAWLEGCASGPNSSTIRPPERTRILANAESVEIRCDTTIKVEAER